MIWASRERTATRNVSLIVTVPAAVVTVFWRRLEGMFPLASVTMTEQSVRPVVGGDHLGVAGRPSITLATSGHGDHDHGAGLAVGRGSP